MTTPVQIVEVAPRDGFQSIATPIPTNEKIQIIEGLISAGLPRIEIGSFVSPRAIPQMADMAEIATHFKDHSQARLSTLVPNIKGAELALSNGIREIVYVFSVSEAHNQNNVRRSVQQSLDTLAELTSVIAGDPTIQLRVALGTSFDCPFDGTVPFEDLLAAVRQVIELAPDSEIALCDTTGVATPFEVQKRFEAVMEAVQTNNWAFHGHDTFGMGVANAFAANQTGVNVFDVSAAGLGGCPFAPGATGNTATEDLVYAWHNSGTETGVDLMKLLSVADTIAAIPDGSSASHVRMVPREKLATH